MTENYEIEKMTVQALEACMKALEEDYVKVLHEGDEAVQVIKKEKHETHAKAHHMKKNTGMEIGNLKRDLECIKKQCDALDVASTDQVEKFKEELTVKETEYCL